MVEKMQNNIGEARRSYALTLESGRFTQEDAARAFGVALSTYRSWEQGVGRGLYGEQLSRIADLYGCSCDYLLCRTDTPEFKSVQTLTKYEKELVDAYRSASPTARAAILASVHAIAASIGEGVGHYEYEFGVTA